MTNYHIGKILGLGLCASALVFTGCSGKDSDEDGSAMTVADTNADATANGTDGSEDMGEEMGDGDPGDGDPGDGDPGSTTLGFVPNNDVIDAATCDPWAQDCPDGEKCAAYSKNGDTWDSNKCVPLMGEGQTGDECTYGGAATGTDDCDVGFMCYYSNEDGIGSCIPLCEGNPDDPICEEDFNCSISNEGSLILCVYACDPLLQDCEQEGTGCYWDGGQFNCDPTAGGIPTNEPCGYINDCDPGHVCLDAEVLVDCNGGACCASICDMSAPECPIMGTECTSFYDEGTAPPGQEDVGICVAPGA